MKYGILNIKEKKIVDMEFEFPIEASVFINKHLGNESYYKIIKLSKTKKVMINLLNREKDIMTCLQHFHQYYGDNENFQIALKKVDDDLKEMM